MNDPEIRIRVASSLSEVDRAQWDACANPDPNESGQSDLESYNPFLSHAFLNALEASGSVGGRTGWSPVHLLIDGADGRLAGSVPAYLKTHSQGEYVFDHGWADAFQRAGGDYYPKVQVAVPFTPVTGRRLLVKPGQGADRMQAALVAGLEALRGKVDASSVHLTFLTKPEWEVLGGQGFLQRTDQQFHFQNQGYTDFEGFLAALSSRKRKMIRRERKEALSPGITVEWVVGPDITEAHWDAFWTFYMDTGARKWGRPYLTRKFFSLISQTMSDRILLILARRENRYIAGAINFIGNQALYGRNWGAIEEHPFLHFEICYYQAIEFAITKGLARVEAGAQGEHKLARGYGPVETYSAHRIADRRLARAVSDYLAQERRHVAEAIETYGEHTPFRHQD